VQIGKTTVVAAGVLVACLVARPARAQGQGQAPGQDVMRGDVGIAYNVLHDSNLQRIFPAGFTLSLAGDTTRTLRIVGEFSGSYKTVTVATATSIAVDVQSYMGGLRFAPAGKANNSPFLEVLAGDVRTSETLIGSGIVGAASNAGGLELGGGLDVKASPHVLIRGQVDYRLVHGGDRQIRIAFGIAIPFNR